MGAGGFISSENADSGPMNPSVGRTMILGIVHSEDAAVTFSVNSFSIGGVAGTELVDRGGATSAINTAIYGWDAAELADASANTSGSIVFSEAVTSCAVGIISVSNISYPTVLGSGTDVGTGTLFCYSNMSTSQMERWNKNGVVICGSTLATAAGTEFPDWGFQTTNTVTMIAHHPIQLYHEGNAEIDCAAAYWIIPSAHFKIGDLVANRGTLAWSGTGAGDQANIFLM